jgi:hypothetical protein
MVVVLNRYDACGACMHASIHASIHRRFLSSSDEVKCNSIRLLIIYSYNDLPTKGCGRDMVWCDIFVIGDSNVVITTPEVFGYSFGWLMFKL